MKGEPKWRRKTAWHPRSDDPVRNSTRNPIHASAPQIPDRLPARPSTPFPRENPRFRPPMPMPDGNLHLERTHAQSSHQRKHSKSPSTLPAPQPSPIYDRALLSAHLARYVEHTLLPAPIRSPRGRNCPAVRTPILLSRACATPRSDWTQSPLFARFRIPIAIDDRISRWKGA